MVAETGLSQTCVYFLPAFLAEVDQYILDHYRQNRVRLSRSNLVTLALKEYIANHPVQEPEPAACAN